MRSLPGYQRIDPGDRSKAHGFVFAAATGSFLPLPDFAEASEIMAAFAKRSTIHQIAVTVGDVGAAIDLCSGVLGLGLLFRAGPDLGFLDAHGVRIMLTTQQGAGAVGANSVLHSAGGRAL